MRHRKKTGRLARRTSWRKATLKSMAGDLITYQRIETTMAKARALRGFAEPLITLAKKSPGSVTARRQAYRKLCDRAAVKSLFDDLAPLYKDVNGGYTRILPLGNRKGDGAQMVVMELTKRTISDDDLLGVTKKARAKAKRKKKEAERPKEAAKGHAAPEVDIEKQEERAVEDVKKEQAKTEQKKVAKRGFFKRFQRKSMG